VVPQPVRFLGCGVIPTRPAPLLGQHSKEVLRELGLR
jgi:CoA:oxalate CoA-transferase